jgi:hypothetical protein
MNEETSSKWNVKYEEGKNTERKQKSKSKINDKADPQDSEMWMELD